MCRFSKAPPMRSKLTGTLGAIAISVAFIGGWEGLETKAYRDIVGVWTVCYGETRGVSPGDSYTKAQCDDKLAKSVLQYETKLSRLVDDKHESNIPIESWIAFVSWIYNVGEGNAAKSTLVKKLNQGDIVGACNELPKWNKAGGRTIKGLTSRRVSEKKLCLSGVGKGK